MTIELSFLKFIAVTLSVVHCNLVVFSNESPVFTRITNFFEMVILASILVLLSVLALEESLIYGPTLIGLMYYGKCRLFGNQKLMTYLSFITSIVLLMLLVLVY